MYKKYFDMGRHIPKYEMKFTDIKPEPLIPPMTEKYDIYLDAIRSMHEKLLEETALPWWMMGMLEPMRRPGDPLYYGAKPEPRKPKVDTGKGPIIDLKPEDYSVIEDPKLLKGETKP